MHLHSQAATQGEGKADQSCMQPLPTGDLQTGEQIFSSPHLPCAEIEAVADDGHERRYAEPRDEGLE